VPSPTYQYRVVALYPQFDTIIGDRWGFVEVSTNHANGTTAHYVFLQRLVRCVCIACGTAVEYSEKTHISPVGDECTETARDYVPI
jgi:hypothetical protein